ncbi:MAG: hypothetical protein Q7U08_06845 [Flavobacteriaceae bacterium]|jgi:hypothetical protein|nr:hypothetical protein [Flavobacteriaceae bacterium]
MRLFYFLFIGFIFSSLNVQSQDKWTKFESVIGQWKGNGIGYGGTTSTVITSFKLVMNNQFIEVKNESVFKPTEKNPKGEIHTDWGLISFDKQRKLYVFRQFHVEGFVNQYILNETESTPLKLVFETETIENFIPGGKARWTININEGNLTETIFDLQMPEKEFVNYGKNTYKRDH